MRLKLETYGGPRKPYTVFDFFLMSKLTKVEDLGRRSLSKKFLREYEERRGDIDNEFSELVQYEQDRYKRELSKFQQEKKEKYEEFLKAEKAYKLRLKERKKLREVKEEKRRKLGKKPFASGFEKFSYKQNPKKAKRLWRKMDPEEKEKLEEDSRQENENYQIRLQNL